MDTKHEALELADWADMADKRYCMPKLHWCADELRRQHARIEELERALAGAIGSLEDYATGAPFDTYDREILEDARAFLTKKD